jgi:hypothetical protein
MKQSKLRTSNLAAIRSVFKSLPSDFQQRYEALKDIRTHFHREISFAFQDKLNQYISQLPQSSFDEKAQTATLINGLLRGIGLTISHNGIPALLVADKIDAAHSSKGRFRIEIRDAHGKPSRPASFSVLPILTLMPEEHRKDFWARRVQKGGCHSR